MSNELDGLFFGCATRPKWPQGGDSLVSGLFLCLGIIVEIHALAVVPAQIVHGGFALLCSFVPDCARHWSRGGRLEGLGKGLGGNGPRRELKLFVEHEVVVEDVLDRLRNINLILI